MTERINLKAIERKVYTSYHQDGLIEIIIAFAILAFDVLLVLEMPWLGGAFAITGFSLYAGAKRAFTVPRIGFVKFPQQRTKRMVMIAVVLGVLANVLGVITFIQVEGGSTPAWLLIAIEHYMLVIGVLVSALFGMIGYTLRANRMYTYSLLTLVMFVAGYFINYPLYYYVSLLGSLILISGVVTLVRFIRKYPIPAKDTAGDLDNEGQQG